MEGVAKTIDAKTREVSMTVYKDGKGQDVSATLRDDAEILINSRFGNLGDVFPGDKLKAYYQKEPGNDSKYVVVKVEVVRSADSGWKKATPVNGPTVAANVQPDTPKPAAAANTERVVKEPDTYDAIYGEIRRQMDEAAKKRWDLLAGGRAPSDVEIRALEQKIMKAKGLLEERGELVEEIDPPIGPR